jgi:hypothetical protein
MKRVAFNVTVRITCTPATPKALSFVIQKLFTSFDSLRNKFRWNQTIYRAWLYTDSAATCFGISCRKGQGRPLTSEPRLLF